MIKNEYGNWFSVCCDTRKSCGVDLWLKLLQSSMVENVINGDFSGVLKSK